MSAIIMDGKALAAKIEEQVREYIKNENLKPSLHIITVGNDPASEVYVRNKIKACERVGIAVFHTKINSYNNPRDVIRFIESRQFSGYILQLPAPPDILNDYRSAFGDNYQDVDGMFWGPKCMYSQPPCTPSGIMDLLEEYGINPCGKKAVVVGRSDIVGRPMAYMLEQANATVTLCHSHTTDLAAETRTADILVVAVGKPNLITADMVKPGATVIDVGINRVDGHLVGDVDFENVKEVAGYITPVPGGVGPLTVASLMRNVAHAAANVNKEWGPF